MSELIQAVNKISEYTGVSAARGKNGELVYYNHRVIGAAIVITLPEARWRLYRYGVKI